MALYLKLIRFDNDGSIGREVVVGRFESAEIAPSIFTSGGFGLFVYCYSAPDDIPLIHEIHVDKDYRITFDGTRYDRWKIVAADGVGENPVIEFDPSMFRYGEGQLAAPVLASTGVQSEHADPSRIDIPASENWAPSPGDGIGAGPIRQRIFPTPTYPLEAHPHTSTSLVPAQREPRRHRADYTQAMVDIERAIQELSELAPPTPDSPTQQTIPYPTEVPPRYSWAYVPPEPNVR